MLDPAENPIPRLWYAAGCFGNFQSHSYGITGGTTTPRTRCGGRISARHAAVSSLGTRQVAASPSLIGSALRSQRRRMRLQPRARRSLGGRIWLETAFRTAIRLIGEAHDRVSNTPPTGASSCLAVLGVVPRFTAAMWTLGGCAPKAGALAPAASEQKDGNGGSSAMDGQPVNWTMDSDCSMCHTVEAASATDASCPADLGPRGREGVTCVQCHTDEAVLSTEHADVKFGDKAATKATVVTVDPETCISCHGTMEEMARQDRGLHGSPTTKGTTVNPHDVPRTRSTTLNPATCTSCHNNHSKDQAKDAMKYCAQCHHRGTFECGTCHELRER